MFHSFGKNKFSLFISKTLNTVKWLIVAIQCNKCDIQQMKMDNEKGGIVVHFRY